jgi:hypothetical protein
MTVLRIELVSFEFELGGAEVVELMRWMADAEIMPITPYSAGTNRLFFVVTATDAVRIDEWLATKAATVVAG